MSNIAKATKQQSVFEDVDRQKRLGIAADFVPLRGDTAAKIIMKIIVAGMYILFIISIFKIVDYFTQNYKAEIMQHEIRQRHAAASQHIIQSAPMSNDLVIYTKPEKKLVLSETAKEFLEINEHTVGYIKIPNTHCDSVVVQYTDNDYYLSHNIYGKPNQAGTIFVDFRAKLTAPNLIIYGHNQKDGTMFGDLDFYKSNLGYWKQNPIIYFNTNYEEQEYIIIASFVTNELPEHDNGYVFDYWNYIYFNKDYPFAKWKKEVLERTMFTTGYDFTDTDDYITLSTCSSEWEPARHVIIARKLRDGETVTTDNWATNPNPRWPQFYYDIYGGDGWKP